MTDEELLERYEPHIKTVAGSMRFKYRLSVEDAEDIMQVMRLKLSQLPHTDVRLAPAYVRTACNNIARNQLETILRFQRELPLSDEPDELSEYGDSGVRDHGAVDDAYDAIESRDHLEKSLDRLSDLQLIFVTMNFGLGTAEPMGVRRIGKALGLGAGTVSDSLAEAISAMRG
jgi:RNA polymerase sigma factor (sigma-70 family)